MKRMKTTMGWLVMAAALTVEMTACSNADSISEEPQQPENPAQKTYTMTVVASKGGDDALTRALTYDSSTKTLNATWKAGEGVKVLGVNDEGTAWEIVGTLYAQSDGVSTTLEGTLDKAPRKKLGDSDCPIQLVFPRFPLVYSGQKGTLADIAANFDYASSHTSDWTETDGNISIDGTAEFNNGTQAIVRFTLKDKDGNALNVKSLKLHDASEADFILFYDEVTATAGDLTISLDDASSEVWVSIFDGITTSSILVMTATTEDGETYTYTRSGVRIKRGSFYSITVKMSKLIDLSKLTADYEAQDGEVLTGTLGGNYKVSIADGAKVTLRDVTVNGTNSNDYQWAGINCYGDAEITLEGTNTLKGFHEYYPGLYIAQGKTLTIKGSGSLTASPYDGGTNNSFGAGIGGGFNLNCGNIVIEGGTITATGGYRATGIGGGANALNCGTITIANTVTKVTATKGTDAHNSIGFGYPGGCGTVIIGGTEYWGYDEEKARNEYKNGGDTYLTTSPLVYEP